MWCNTPLCPGGDCRELTVLDDKQDAYPTGKRGRLESARFWIARKLAPTRISTALPTQQIAPRAHLSPIAYLLSPISSLDLTRC
jgi:hypothetical protein